MIKDSAYANISHFEDYEGLCGICGKLLEEGRNPSYFKGYEDTAENEICEQCYSKVDLMEVEEINSIRSV